MRTIPNKKSTDNMCADFMGYKSKELIYTNIVMTFKTFEDTIINKSRNYEQTRKKKQITMVKLNSKPVGFLILNRCVDRLMIES